MRRTFFPPSLTRLSVCVVSVRLPRRVAPRSKTLMTISTISTSLLTALRPDPTRDSTATRDARRRSPRLNRPALPHHPVVALSPQASAPLWVFPLMMTMTITPVRFFAA